MKARQFSLLFVLAAITLTIASLTIPAHADSNISGHIIIDGEDGKKYIKDHYLVTLQDDLVDPPNPAMRGQVPVGEPTSGQSKEELAQMLNLDGEILSILEMINAIYVRMDEEEALRLNQDASVLRIEQSTVGTIFEPPSIPHNGNPAGFPTYQSGTLTIPRIDTPEHIALYQDVTLQFDEQTGLCQLANLNVKPVDDSMVINHVQVAVTEAFPAQVFLRIFGEFSDGCEVLGQVNQHLTDKRFDVTLHSSRMTMEDDACAKGTGYVEKVVPLQVYGLDAGSYEYSINNGQHTGTFTLERDNKF